MNKSKKDFKIIKNNINKRGYFGVAIYNPKKSVNVGTLWRTAGILEASFLATINKRYIHQCSDTLKTPRHTPLFHYEYFDEFKKYLPSECQLIGIEINEDAIDLKRFKHPERACYILGAEDHGLPEFILEQCNSLIQLKGKFCYNLSIAGSIVLYHRVFLNE